MNPTKIEYVENVSTLQNIIKKNAKVAIMFTGI
jgi:hypothetical protein